MSRILLTGKHGQVGYELERSLQGLGEIVALDRQQLDLSDLAQVRQRVREIRPTLIVNAAAYTAVDKAESEPDLAMRINGEAPGVMAEEARKLGAVMIHYSTDYVFDGSKPGPYTEDDAPCPLNVYGATKLAGERAVQAVGIPYLILRTSWVYGLRGKNFLRTVLQLARERDELRIVVDQHGSPTWCRTIADTTAHIVAQGYAFRQAREWWQERAGIFHLSASGDTTWYGFAREILDRAGIAQRPQLTPITTENYPLPAKRPANSVMCANRLRKIFCGIPEWREALKLCMGHEGISFR